MLYHCYMSIDATFQLLNDEFDVCPEVCEPARGLPEPESTITLGSDESPNAHRHGALHLSDPAQPTNSWDPRLVLDLAVGVDALDEILLRYRMTREEFEFLASTRVFRRELALTIKDVKENGISFARKAAVQAEGYLAEIDGLVYDKTTPASTRLEAIRSTVRWGRLEAPKDSVEDGNKTQVNVQINF